MQDKHTRKKELMSRFAPYAVSMFVLGTACVFGVSRYVRAGLEATVRNTVCAAAFSLVLAFVYGASMLRHTLLYDNENKPGRFFASYAAGLLFACGMRFVPFTAWPYTPWFVLLVFSSGEAPGFYAATALLTLSVLLSGSVARTALVLYLTCGLCAVSLFYGFDKNSSLRAMLVPTVLLQAVFSAAYYLLFTHTEISLKIFVLPLINLVLTTILLALVTRVFRRRVLGRQDDRYLDINDPGFSLLQALRTKSPDDYFRAIHTAYLTERVASALNWRAHPAKTCALYHRIGRLDDRDSVWSEVEHYYTEFDFPPEAVSLLYEYISSTDKKGPVSGEAVCVMMCDMLVASLTYVFKKDKDARVDYEDMIDRLFAHQMQEGKFAASGVTLRELESMKDLLKREKLYYDFLR